MGRDLGEVADDGGHAAAGGGAARQVEGHELHVRHVGRRLEVRQRVKIQLPAQNARSVSFLYIGRSFVRFGDFTVLIQTVKFGTL